MIIPSEAAVPALVLVGFLMMQQVKGIDWDDLEIAIPAFLTIVLMPFTYSITVGIGAGFITYVFIKLVRGKVADVHPLLWVVAAAFVVYFAIDPITGWLDLSRVGASDPSRRSLPHRGRLRRLGISELAPELVSMGNELC